MYPQGAYRTGYCGDNQEERNGRGSGDFESSRQQGGIRGISPDHNARLNKGAIPREGTPNQKGRTILPKKDKDKPPTKVINSTVITISTPGILKGRQLFGFMFLGIKFDDIPIKILLK